ncbi:MAG: DUF2304 domain-containing protein [Planctomycetes bacterium]|nr:DUF2304 domain-containing protein [Planctomycetota bacterium]
MQLLAAASIELEPMPGRQRLVAVLLAAGLVALTFELVRRRKLREEYSWVWITTAVVLAVLALQQDLLLTVSRWIGSSNVVSTLFFGAFLFVLALLLQVSVRLSRLTHRHRTLGQRLALLEEEVARLRAQQTGPKARRDKDKGEVA